MSKSSTYSVKQLAKLAGVTVKTLHLYDQKGILKLAEAYKGLGQLYLTDERFTNENGASDENFRVFISEAMTVYSESLVE